MLSRHVRSAIEKAMAREAAVALVGPRQVGKTTLALEIAAQRPSVYLDLERLSDREKLSDPVTFLNLHRDELVVLDEIHRLPELFSSLRGIIDQGRRDGRGRGRFLLLGSASMDLMRQSETLAGRIEYVDLGPFNALELEEEQEAIRRLWVRGGFPRSYLAENDEDSLRWRQNFIRTYLERDVPMFGPRLPVETLERLWTMLAHNQGGLLNASQLGRNLSLSGQSVANYLGLLTDLLLIRRLPPFHANVGKRLVKSPKIYVRDSGLVHALLNIETLDDLLGHPVVGASWEGMVIETLLAVAPWRTRPSFYRTARGAEIDLVLELGAQHGTWAIEIKSGSVPRSEKGFAIALDDIQPSKAFLLYGGSERYPKAERTEAVGLRELAQELKSLQSS
jgi:predicted AAA+ superfamily ATPase